MKEGLEVRLLGPPVVVRDGAPVALPRSRKVITLLALLALDGVPHSRSRLCDLLWDLPNDPRAELRWCLSKLRAVVDQPARRRIVTKGNTLVALDLAGVCFDCAEVQGERVNATSEPEARSEASRRIDEGGVIGILEDGRPGKSGYDDYIFGLPHSGIAVWRVFEAGDVDELADRDLEIERARREGRKASLSMDIPF